MLYVGDHGDSRRDDGLYPHGMRYRLVPREQTRVLLIVWTGDSSNIRLVSARDRKGVVNSQYVIFDTLLKLFEARPRSAYEMPELFEMTINSGWWRLWAFINQRVYAFNRQCPFIPDSYTG